MSDMQELKNSVTRLQSDVTKIRDETVHAHRRIDKVADSIGEMRADVAKVAACVDPLCRDVGKITEAIIGNAFVRNDDSSDNNRDVMLKIIDAIKWLIIASIAIGCVSAAGYYGLKASAKNGQTEINIERPQ